MLHLHCIYAVFTLYLRCTYTVFMLYLHCIYTAFTLCLRCIYSIFTLCLCCVYTAVTLHLHHIHAVLYLHCIFNWTTVVCLSIGFRTIFDIRNLIFSGERTYFIFTQWSLNLLSDCINYENRCCVMLIEAFRVLTSLCISDICLANWVSGVSGRSEYKLLPVAFFPSSLYFT